MNSKTGIVGAMALSLGILLSGCLPDAPSGEGTLRVSLTDAPACGMNEVNVTIKTVRVHQSSTAADSDDGWHDVAVVPARQINLLTLTNSVLEELGQATLPSGHYTQLRLVLDTDTSGERMPNSVFPVNDSEQRPLTVPSGLQSGIKLVGEFDVAEATLTDVTLDFDACRSVIKQGNNQYRLNPVIRVIPNAVSGSIQGVVDPALLPSTPVVIAQINGQVIKQVSPDPVSGAFNLAPLLQSSTAGNYDVVITADNHGAAVITGVPVLAQAVATVSSTADPLDLTVSAENTVSGTVSPLLPDNPAQVSVSQLVGGNSYSIGWTRTDAGNGSYQLTLPLAAPSLAAWNIGTLPLDFTLQDSTAGQFLLTASATGYTPVPLTADVREADQVLDFMLQALPL